MKNWPTKHTTGLFWMIILLGGCASTLIGEGSPPTRYFILSPLTLPETSGSNLAAADPEVSVAVEPLVIPSYLNRSQIVIMNSASELSISEFNQWGENLRDNLSRVLVENLSLLLDSDQIYLMPGLKRQEPDFRVMVRIVQFERTDKGTVQLTVRWKLQDQSGKQILFREGSVLAGEQVGKEDYPAIAIAMSHLLSEFSRRMAETIQRYKGSLATVETR